jgi:H+/Cl- antiporter ClcA
MSERARATTGATGVAASEPVLGPPEGLPVDRPSAPTVRTLLALSIPAIIVGVVSALVLYALDELALLLEHWFWDALPNAIGVTPGSGWWTFAMLTVVGLAVGLVIRFVPGHGGPDSAAHELIGPPIPLRTVPSLLLVTVLALAGGVSLGPEGPIVAINTAILVTLVRRLWPRVPVQLIVMMTAAGTIGALFGTPLAAALVFTGMVGAIMLGAALWDKLFLPLVAAGAGATTMILLDQPSFALDLPAYDSVAPLDLLTVTVIAGIAAALGLGAAALMPRLHAAFRLLRNPVLYVTLGGMVLGLLGAIGGPITLCKGLTQMGELTSTRGQYAAGGLILVTLVKVAALVVAAAAGFRGGRIFPAVFIGVALGLSVSALIPTIPPALAVAGGVLGVVLAVARDGWIALFVAVAVTGGTTVIPLLCVAILPAWLLVSRGPEMIVHRTGDHASAEILASSEKGPDG